MWLSDKDRRYLNEVYANAYKKYFGWTAAVPGGKPFSYAEALAAAREELETFYEVRRAEINAKHDARVLAINTEANKRGLLTSTIVMQQIAKAEYEHGQEIAKFETVTDAKVRIAARKMMADDLGRTKLCVQTDRDAQEFFIRKTTIGGVPTADLQKAMDEEVYAEYLRFLLRLDPEVALAYITDDPLFYYNLSAEYFDKLKVQIERRGWNNTVQSPFPIEAKGQLGV